MLTSICERARKQKELSALPPVRVFKPSETLLKFKEDPFDCDPPEP